MSNSRKIASLPNVLTLLDDAGGEFLAQQAAATTTSYTVTWPGAVGGSGALLGTTNSAGAMGWLTALSGLTINNSIIGGSTPAAITGTTVTATSNFVGDITGDVTGNADTATTLATPRTFSITGDGTSTFAAFNGSADVSGALTLATVNSNVGSFGSTTAIPVVTVNAKGLVTAVSTASISSTLTVAADSGSDDTITVGTDTLTFAGTANEIETTVSDNQIQIGLPSTILTTTQSAGDNSTKVATTAYVDSATAALVDSAPSTLDTLNELAAALGDDANFSTTITNSVAAKLPLAGGTMTGDIELDDSVKVSFGNSQDLQIYHAPNASPGLVRNNVDIAAGGIEFNITQGGFDVNIGSNEMMSIGSAGTAFYGLISVDKLIQSNDHGIDLSAADKILPWDNGIPGNSDNALALGSSSYRFSELHAAGIYGTLQTAAQTNITSLGTLTGLTVSSTISGSVSGSAGSAGTAATVTGSSQTAITSVGTLSSLAVSGDVTVDTNTLKVDTTNNRVGILNASPDVTLDVGSATDAVHMPVGTTAQRPSSPAAGYFRYNSTLSKFEGYTDEWGEIGGGGGSNTFTKDSFSGDGSTTAFALSQTTGSEDNLIAFIDGVFQTQSAYSIVTASGTTTLTFSVAPPNGTEIIVYSVASAVSGANLNLDTMTGDGSTVAMSLSISAVNENNTQVYFDGVYQSKANYSISGTTLTFSTAPATGVEVEVMTMTQTEINVPVDNTVTAAKLTSDSVTTAKILDDNVTAAKLEHDINLVGNPTTTTQSASDNSTKIATTAYVETAAAAAAAAVVDAAPSTLDTLNELAAALGDDPNFATTVTNSIAAKAPIANPTFTGSFTSPGIDDNADAIAITIDSSEKVGIGVTSPSNYYSDNLVVAAADESGITLVSDPAHQAYVMFADGTSGSQAYRGYFGYDHGSDFLNIVSSGTIRFYSDDPSTEAMRIDSSGDLILAANATGAALIKGVSGDQTDRNTGGYPQFTFVGNEGTGIRRPSANVLAFDTSGDEAMRIDSSGNVKIGSPAGTEKLSVQGSITSDGYIYPTTDNGWSLGLSTNRWGSVFAQTVDVETQVKFTSVSYDDRAIGLDSTGFYLYNNDDSRYDLVVNQSGIVGIGNSSPSNGSLCVAGVLALDPGGPVAIDASNGRPNLARAADGELRVAAGKDSSSQITFHTCTNNTTNAVERMRINSNGKVEVIASGQTYVHHINNGTYSWLTGTDGNNYNFYSAEGTLRGKLTVTGVFTDTSDRAYKKDIKDIGYGLAEVKQLQPRAYKMEVNNEDQLGFIAQEMEQVIPEVVSGEEGSKGLAYGHLVPVLVKAIQEQQDLIEALTARITALEGE